LSKRLKGEKVKLKISRRKSIAATIALILTLTVTISLVAFPIFAQYNLIMNLPGNEGEPHYLVISLTEVENYDIDLNEGPGGGFPMELWVKYPGRADFTYINTYTTTSSGDLDVYDFDFNETGSYELQWRDSVTVSNIETVITVTDPADLPPQYITEYYYADASPKIVGVGQTVLLIAWTNDLPPDIGEQTGEIPSPTGRAGWYDCTVTVTTPAGTNETLEFGYTDPVGAAWVQYVPTTVGEYTIQATFPGAWKNSTSGNRYYTPDLSDPETFTVQEEQITAWPETPLPTEPWNRPINSANRFWGPVAGNWLEGSANQYPIGAGGGTTSNYAYGLGTGSPHILWTKQYYTGGLMDQQFGGTGFATAHYQGLSWGGIIVQGKLHYTPRITHAGTSGWAILDLYTGEELYFDYDANRPSRGQIYNYESPNQHGGFAYTWRTSGVTLPETVHIAHARQLPDLSLERIRSATTVDSANLSRTGTVWEMIDALTDQTICYIANVSTSGTGVYAKDGSMLYYNVENLGGTNYLQCWNSSAGTMVISPYGTGFWQWRPAGGGFGGAEPFFGSTAYNNVHDGNLMWSLNVSIPSLQGPTNSRQNQTAQIQCVREGEYVIFSTTGINDNDGIAPTWLMAVSLEPGHEGEFLWETTFNPPYDYTWGAGYGNGMRFSGVYPDYGNGVVLFDNEITCKYYGYDMKTGAKLWESDPQVPFTFYGVSENVYDGILYSHGYSGVIYAYNITTGDLIWRFDAFSEGFEGVYGGRYPIGIGIISSDGKLYTNTGEHSPTQPLYRGRNLRCIDAETGEELWSILGFFGGMSPTSSYIIMGDGILVGLNLFDNQLYAFGKGPSATTVTAPDTEVPLGSSVVIRGTVTDQTQGGRRNTNDVFEFSLKGTPAISDEDMGRWMEYMFMQQPYPNDAKGVEVVLYVLDSNNNYYEIGRTTSDVTGAFSYTWEPEITGDYTITAGFEGSESYGPSSANTAITVGPAPSPGQPQETEPPTTAPPPTTEPPTTAPPPTTEPPTTAPPTTAPPPTGEAPLISTETAIAISVAIAAVIGIAAYWAFRRRQVK
jgi:outer membrane protein assembly factor BamB